MSYAAEKKAAHYLTMRRDPMQEITDRIIESLEAGIRPRVRPWDHSKCAGPQAPFNPTTRDRYHDINVLMAES